MRGVSATPTGHKPSPGFSFRPSPFCNQEKAALDLVALDCSKERTEISFTEREIIFSLNDLDKNRAD
jgi:hypothetical protein